MRPTIIPGKKNPAARPDPSIKFTSAETLMSKTNLNNHIGTTTKHEQAILAPLAALIDPLQFVQILGQVDGFDILARQLEPKAEEVPPAPGEEFVDHDFFGDICARAGLIHDCPTSGFHLQRLHVCDRRRQFLGSPTANTPEGFERWRMAGADGVPRIGDRDAATLVYSRTADSFMFIKRDGMKPQRITFFQLCRLLTEHRRDLDEAAV